MPELIWKPSARQEQFLSLPDTIFEALYGGAAAGGKSEALIMLPLVRGFYKHPKFKGIIFRRTFKELEDEIITRSQNWYPATGGRYNESKKRWTWPSGAIQAFGHAEYENDVRKYDSAEYNYMAFDELTSFTEAQYIYLAMSRCRTSCKDLPAIVRGATNPGNVGHQWVRSRFIENIPYGSVGLDKLTKQKRIFIQSKVQDNPHIDPGYVFRLQGLPEAERRAKLDGDWYTFEGQVFEDWRALKIQDEPENALHVVPAFDIPKWWPRILAIDWGYSAMTCALWGAISPEGRLYIYKEYTTKKTKISHWATEIGRMSVNEDICDIVMCQSAWQDRGEDLTIQEQFKKYSNLQPHRADNARIAGKIMIQEYLRWDQKPESKFVREPGDFNSELANRILRNQGIDAYKSYVASFEPTAPEVNLPKLQIFDTVKSIQLCLPLCIYDKKSGPTSKPSEDVKEFDGDDPYDTLRYLILAADSKINSAVSEGKYRVQVQKEVEQLTINNNWTSFHRNMEKLEREAHFTPKPVRARIHRYVSR